MALHPPHEKEQLRAIEIGLATAPKIQDDFRNYISRITEPYDKVGLDDSIFDFAELVGYRINNKLEDIAEDLDVKSLYGLTTDKVALNSVSYAFRGHHNKDFFPEDRFDGLFGKELNDYIEEIRKEKGGRNRMALLSDEERSKLAQKGGLIGGRARALAQGQHVWSLEEIADIHNFREESIGKGRRKTQPSWDYITSNMNEKYDKDWTTVQVKRAYQKKKHRLTDEEE
tara:strand:+ start:509 stop:1192 length:684 start_codon:yes stop_codon:yes gene_type:complete